MNANTLKAVTRHGESLLRAFPNATERDPVALCKKLRRIENSLTRPLCDACNLGTEAADKAADEACDKALQRAQRLLYGPKDKSCGRLLVNRDPRGYALKLDDAWTRAYNDKEYGRPGGLPIYSDLGSYGILAPDLNQK